MTEVVLVSCSKSKQDGVHHADKLYEPSDIFQKRRNLARQRGDHWGILSGKFGYLRPWDIVSNYEKHRNERSAVWGAVVLHDLLDDLDYWDADQVTILAGGNYVEPLVTELESHGYDVLDYNSGLRPGERKAALKEALLPGEQSTLVTDGGVDLRLNQLAGEYGVPVEARCVGCTRDDRDRVRVKLADPDVFPDEMDDAGSETFKHVCHRCQKATYWNTLELIDDVVLERVDELDEHDRDVPEKVVRFLDEDGNERGDRSTYRRTGGKPLAVATDGGEPQ